ncbi:MAG: OmpA family protein [Spirochaetales bacterium]|nr:OmpA family protein [Spirochaetales bacterium]
MKRSRALSSLAALLALLGAGSVGAQVVIADAATSYGPLRYAERGDWSRYDDGRYVGLTRRETRGVLVASPFAGGVEYRGDFYVLEETKRDESLSARAVDEVLGAAWRVGGDGRWTMLEDPGWPSLRGVPAFPSEPVRVGDRWVAEGSRSVDPRGVGKPTRVPVLVQYEFKGEREYRGERVLVVAGKFATRYRKGQDPSGDRELEGGTGTHDFEALVDADSGRLLLLRDSFDDTWTYAGRRTVRQKGFVLLFYEGATPIDRVALAEDFSSAIGERPTGGFPPAPSPSTHAGATGPGSGSAPPEAGSGPEAAEAARKAGLPGLAEYPEAGLELREVERGIALTIKDLRFIADSDELLPSEKARLDLVAAALATVEGRSFLVEGHTASVGRPADELALSERRAKRVVDELVARGLEARRFIWRGLGSTRPLAPNDTEGGRALNRRVEITILQD